MDRSRLLKTIRNFDDYFNVFFLGLMTVIIFIQVIFRYLFNRSLSWSEELVILMFIWVCFLGAAGLAKRGGHFGFDNLVIKMPKKVQLVIDIFGDMVACLFVACFTFGGIILMISGTSHVTGALALSMRIVYSIIPIAGTLYFVRVVVRSAHKIKGFREG